MERTVAHVWCEVLTLDAVGLDENFFDLGGHSLLLAGVHARLEERLGTEFPLYRLFEHPTVRTTARFLTEGEHNQSNDRELLDRLTRRTANRRAAEAARRNA